MKKWVWVSVGLLRQSAFVLPPSLLAAFPAMARATRIACRGHRDNQKPKSSLGRDLSLAGLSDSWAGSYRSSTTMKQVVSSGLLQGTLNRL